MDNPLELRIQLEAALSTVQRQQEEIGNLRHTVTTLQNALTRPSIALFTDKQLDILIEFIAAATEAKGSEIIH